MQERRSEGWASSGKTRGIALFLCLAVMLEWMPGSITAEAKKKKALKDYPVTSYDWGLRLNREHKKPGGSGPAGWKLKKDAAYYVGKHSKKDPVVYLTFDCGYEAGYTRKILKKLKKNKVKALFFVTRPYIMQNPGIVKRMKKEGHLVGNHTSTHPRMAKLGVKRIRKEIRDCEKAMEKKTGYEMDPYLRPPEGNFSIRSVKVAQSMGYATIFWSLAYYDYDTANQPGADYVVRKFRMHHHNGMIPLIHTCSKSNTEALGKVIKLLKKKGYRFGTLDEFIFDTEE
ncbi:MAG: polysaccharide deacetylase family protein [Eubacterium sp.]|nr:polysaccharide deacetylase family protein [Eubacterium sp.]